MVLPETAIVQTCASIVSPIPNLLRYTTSERKEEYPLSTEWKSPDQAWLHPLGLNSRAHWQSLQSRYPIDPSHKQMESRINLFTRLHAPFHALEKMLYDKAIRNTTLPHDPIFILGHWRCGTTHLHNLLCQDPRHAFVETFQVVMPSAYFVAKYTLRPIFSALTPKTRPMDAVPLSQSTPQEEDMGVANYTRHSPYVGWYFPRQWMELFKKYTLFENISDEDFKHWQEDYHYALQHATYADPGKRLVLKNPPNTGRIPQLLEQYPNAKFVHIHRCPYRVYKSTVRLHQAITKQIGLQTLTEEELLHNVQETYPLLMQRYLDTKDLIPPENFFEVAYDDLDDNPLETMEALYTHLDLPDWPQARTAMDTYLHTLGTHEKNTFTMAAQDIATVQQHWKIGIDTWNYPEPEVKA